jgi:hypothetical protein
MRKIDNSYPASPPHSTKSQPISPSIRAAWGWIGRRFSSSLAISSSESATSPRHGVRPRRRLLPRRRLVSRAAGYIPVSPDTSPRRRLLPLLPDSSPATGFFPALRTTSPPPAGFPRRRLLSTPQATSPCRRIHPHAAGCFTCYRPLTALSATSVLFTSHTIGDMPVPLITFLLFPHPHLLHAIPGNCLR